MTVGATAIYKITAKIKKENVLVFILLQICIFFCRMYSNTIHTLFKTRFSRHYS